MGESGSDVLLRNRVLACSLLILLNGCSLLSETLGEIPSDKRAFMAEDVEHRQMQFAWIQLPEFLEEGEVAVQVFLARLDPPSSVVPMLTELPCLLQSEDDNLEIRPAAIEFQYDGDQLRGEYSWQACASCVECYMDWETRMEITLTPAEEALLVSLAIRHMGHNLQDEYLNIEIPEIKPSRKEPALICSTSGCDEIEFLPAN